VAIKIVNYQQAFFGLLNMKLTDDIKIQLIRIEKEGYSERAICYAIWRSQEKLCQFRNDSRFWSVLHNEVRKHSFKINDPHWQKVKEEKEKIEKKDNEQKERILKGKKIFALEEYKPGKGKNFVYFIQGEDGGPIKIGTSKNVENRLHALQTGFPHKLVVLAVIKGNDRIERGLHYKFKNYRLSGEWFKPAEELLEYINSLAIKT